MRNQPGMAPALVVGGHTMALGVVRALGSMGVPVVVLHYDRRDTAHLSRYCAHRVRAPHPGKSEAGFIGLVMDLAGRFRGGVIFPVSDEAVVAVARHKPALRRHYIVACPDWPVVRRFIDKKHTYALAAASGVPAPKTVVPSSIEDVQVYGSQVAFPCLVKPCQSHLFYDRFQRKMFPAANLDEMISVYRRAAEAGLEVMLQEIIPGGDAEVVNYNAYFYQGRPAVEFTAVHVRNAPPRWGSPRVAVSKEVPEVIGPGRRLLEAMGYAGYACTEFKRDPRDGIYKLMEVNGRHNLSTLLAVACGVNFPWLEYRHLVHGELPPLRRPAASGIYWIDITRDAAYSARNLLRERYSPGRYLAPYFRPHVFAILDRKDPRPFAARCVFLAREAARGVLARLAAFAGRVRCLKPPLRSAVRLTRNQCGKLLGAG
ncbi:MAG: hypothetical protein J7M38_03495 [Armatimonadetes bacterium]|nr:hypothetical protein [Armatimonadota bacterium]